MAADSLHSQLLPSGSQIDGGPSLPRAERILILVALAVALVLRVIYAFHYRLDSDEAQHLHIAWLWTVGLMPYRDAFDNHSPLFHLLVAPVLALLGERSDIFAYMRLLTSACFLLMLWGIYRIGRRVFDRRVAAWTVALLALFPLFHLKSLEFRTDDLWAALWVMALLVAIAGPLSVGRSFLVGLLFGAGVSVSMKTIVLLVAFLGAGLTLLLLLHRDRARPSLRTLLTCAAAGLLGFLLLPVGLAAFFIAKGLWQPMYYCIVQHNVGVTPHWFANQRYAGLAVTLPLAAFQTVWLLRARPLDAITVRRWLIVQSNVLFLLILFFCWPLLDDQDYLPIYPFAALVIVSILLGAQGSLFGGKPAPLAVPCLIAAGLFLGLIIPTPPWRNELLNNVSRGGPRLVAQVLRMTDRQDLVLDPKGDCVYRHRPVHYIFEVVTKEKFFRHIFVDDIPDRLIASGTCVAVPGNYPEPRTRGFLKANYLRLGQLLVAGQSLPDAAVIDFQVTIPGTYAIVRRDGVCPGLLDGTPLIGSRRLDPGPHRFQPDASAGPLALIWAKAVERGYWPTWPEAP